MTYLDSSVKNFDIQWNTIFGVAVVADKTLARIGHVGSLKRTPKRESSYRKKLRRLKLQRTKH